MAGNEARILGRPSGRPARLLEVAMDTSDPSVPRYLYVAACYSRRESSAYHLLVTSNEEHDPDTDAGTVAIVRLLAQASERRVWFASDEAFRDEVRRTYERISDEIHDLSRYALPKLASGTEAWAPASTDLRIWNDARP